MMEGVAFEDGLLERALDQLSLARSALFRAILAGNIPASCEPAGRQLAATIDALRRAGQQDTLPLGLLSRAWLRFLHNDAVGARADLDEAWDIAERGPMRLQMTDIHLYRARLFFREKPYPWRSPQEDLAAAAKLINDCGYHRRDEELADAKRAILGTN
jgi:hypothetical protein